MHLGRRRGSMKIIALSDTGADTGADTTDNAVSSSFYKKKKIYPSAETSRCPSGNFACDK